MIIAEHPFQVGKQLTEQLLGFGSVLCRNGAHEKVASSQGVGMVVFKDLLTGRKCFPAHLFCFAMPSLIKDNLCQPMECRL